MKLRYFLIPILAMLLTPGADAAVNFAPSSRLNTGKWVKVGIEQSGVYEISYQTLRDMGFSNPESITIFGRGGAQLSTNFTSAGGSVLYSDELPEIPVFHHNDKVYYYGVGVEKINFTISSKQYECGGYFSAQPRNIYSKKGYYFISDTGSAPKMKQVSSNGVASLDEMSSGISFLFHEEDLCHNHTDSGQLFFGEKTTHEKPQVDWDIFLPGAIENASGAMHCHYYIDRKIAVELRYGLEGAPDPVTTITTESSSANFTAVTPEVASTTITGPVAKAFVYCDPGDTITTTSHVDHWTITYQRNIPDLVGLNEKLKQDRISFPKLARNKSAKIRIPGGASYMAMDITYPTAPSILSVVPDGADGLCKISHTGEMPQLVIFNPMVPQLQISGYTTDYTEIKNQNLHAELAQGADLIIICTESLRESAERLADLHRNYDNMRVVVGTTNEIYNEFSGGVPDPMAYRAAVKMAYQSAYSCKNLLLMGPLFADFRGVINEKDPEGGIIAYQSHPMNQSRGAMNVNDFYGMMNDYFSTSLLENQKVQVGVGILPVRYPAEADIVIDKVENFLNVKDHEYYMNLHTSIGGVGDNHTHDQQAVSHSAYLNNIDNGSSISTTIAIDAYGYKEAQRKFFSNLNEGRYLATYYGHGGEYTLNREGDFFYSSDVFKLRNKINPLMLFAGCTITNSDRGVHGIGSSVVTATPYGMLGSIVATRETWAGQNEEFVKQFYVSLFRNGVYVSSPYHEKNLTIGEVWAKMKTLSVYNNELAYQLICDPAITIPVVNRNLQTESASYEATPGEYLEFSGYVPLFNDVNSVDTEFNGTVVARLMEPAKIIRSTDICTGTNEKPLDVRYADTQLSMSAADVVDGKFTVRLFVPAESRQFIGETAYIHAVTYDAPRKIGAGRRIECRFADTPEGSSSAEMDNEAPEIIRFEYDNDLRALNVEVTDNFALSFADSPLVPTFQLYIDGINYPGASSMQPQITDSGRGFSKNIPVVDLARGTHLAKIKVFDANGNVGYSELSFDYNPEASRFAIALEESAVAGYGTFTSIGETPASADILILDTNGMLVRRDRFDGSSYRWDACDNAGSPVAKGLYKAYIIETGNKSGKGHSATISVPVI